jgi:cytochrome c oxidase assembly factor CtaG
VESSEITPSSLLSAWSWYPSVILGIVLVTAGYFIRMRQLSGWKGNLLKGFHGRVYWFLAGMLVIFLALLSPLDEIGDEYLFSAHMIQHLLLTLVAPPLLLLGLPAGFFKPVLQNRNLLKAARFLTAPVAAYALFNFDFLIWHLPELYQATLENESLHIFEHLTFIIFGVLNWWPVLGSEAELPRLPSPAQVLYLFLEAVPASVLGGILVFSPQVLYATYARAPQIFGLTALEDQQISGFIMWMPGGMFYMAVLTYVFFSWLRKEDQKQPESSN